MRTLVAQSGRNAVRQAKKLKEIRKVKNAIQWHEKERKKRQTVRQEQWESKQAVIQRIKWENNNVHGVRKKALAEVKEDWRLGPLRPNRAFGDDKAKHGALTGEQVQKPAIPLRSVKDRNEFRERKGLAPEYPLIVDDKKYFHIVKDDRVAILKGKDKGKIGVVVDVIERSHQVMVKGLNMQYFDSDLFNGSERNLGPRHEAEAPIDMTDVRLVVPYESIQGERRRYSDAIVEEVRMVRHTTGIDPFTGTDYGSAEIPKDHQYDPGTGLPIFHRYIAGTQQRIEWPWEKPKVVKKDEFTPPSAQKSRKQETLVQKAMTTIRHPITSIKSWTSKPERTAVATKKLATKKLATRKVSTKNVAPMTAGRARQISLRLRAKDRAKQERFDAQELERQKATPRSIRVDRGEGYDGIDSPRSIIQDTEATWYTLIEPPFPHSISSELQDHIHDRNIEVRKGPDAPPKIKIKLKNKRATKTLRAKLRGVQSMKTPMQLRWEMEQAKKVADRKKNPLVETDALLAALGKHMVANGVKIPKNARKVEEDVD